MFLNVGELGGGEEALHVDRHLAQLEPHCFRSLLCHYQTKPIVKKMQEVRMALIRSFKRKSMERNSLHDEIEATYSVFERDGRVFIQIDSYGRDTREMPGKKSQTVQIDREGAVALIEILKSEFRLT